MIGKGGGDEIYIKGEKGNGLGDRRGGNGRKVRREVEGVRMSGKKGGREGLA